MRKFSIPVVLFVRAQHIPPKAQEFFVLEANGIEKVFIKLLGNQKRE